MAKKKCRSNIGGQAVLEGVMMMSERSIATAVRDEKGVIQVEAKHAKANKEKSIFRRIPFVRGVLNFGTSMFTGVGIILRSSAVFEAETEPSKFEKWAAQKLKINVMSVIMGIAVILGIGLAIGLFFVLPHLISGGIESLINKYTDGIPRIWYNLIDGVLRIGIFVLYIALTTLMKEIKRTFMYHGAEHKTISCFEHGEELTVANVQKQSTIHDRCGTTFMFLVMVISILMFSIVNIVDVPKQYQVITELAIKLALLPVVAGVAYEILKFLAKFDNWFVKIIKAPGLLLQKLTTKQPTDEMVEVAIVAFNTVLAMDADPNIPETKFDTKVMFNKVKLELDAKVSSIDGGAVDLEWIICDVLNIKRSEIGSLTHIRTTQLDKIQDMVARRLAGVPLQQVIGNTDFYGITIKVNGDVLCPRPETEYLVEQAVKIIRDKGITRIHDLCTGSGAIAITVKSQCPNCEVSASDISESAIDVANNNCIRNEVNVRITVNDMFSEIGTDYDMIISNPPYIPTADIDGLSAEVKDHEPRIALDGGADGLDYYRIIAAEAKKHIIAGGYLLLEVGYNQAEQVKELLNDGYINIEFAQDLEKIDRIVIAEVA